MLNNTKKDKNNFLLSNKNSEIMFENSFELHNHSIIESFKSFLQSENSYFLLQGFMGEGKSLLLKKFEEYISRSDILLKFECTDFSSLDDFLLTLNIQLKSAVQKIGNGHLNVQTKDFRERIKQLIKNINLRIIIFFDGYETLKSNNSCDTILSFIEYLTSNKNVKIVISGRVIGNTFFENKRKQKSIMKSFSVEETKNYIAENYKDIDLSVLEKIYQATDGHYLYITLFCKLMNMFSMSPENLINEFFKKSNDYSEFLAQKLLGLVPQNYNEILWYFCLCRSFINDKMLKNMNLVKKDELKYLKKINILYENEGNYCIKDYFKQFVESQISNYKKLKIYKNLKDYYASQIKLKVAERDVNFSRETLRKLVEYYGSFIVETPEIISQPQNIKALPQQNQQQVIVQETKQSLPQKSKFIKNKQVIKTKEVDNILISDEEYKLLQDEEQNMEIRQSQQEDTEKIDIVVKKSKNKSLLQLAEGKEQIFDYDEALRYYKQAYDNSDETEKYYVLSKIANNYKKMGQFDKATEIYKKIADYYQRKGSITKYAYILYSIALVYKEQYNIIEAKKCYGMIVAIKDKLPDSLLAQVNLDIAEISDYSENPETILNFYNKALEHAQNTTDNVLTAEIYFKYGLFLDDREDYQAAVTKYLASTITCFDSIQNKYLSLAYANVGAIYEEQDKKQDAVKYYLKAVSADESSENYEGLYFLYIKLGNLYQKLEPKKVMTLNHKALFAAQKLKDNFYICSALLNIGDYYYQENNTEQALRYYLNTRKYAVNLKSAENIEIIKSRIKDIKIKLGQAKFKECIERLKKNANKK